MHPCCRSFYGWVVFCCTMYHFIFIHSSVNGHLGCFCVLAIANSAAVNIGVHISFQISIFSREMPRNGIAGLYGNSIFSFQGTSTLFSIVASPTYIPTNGAGGLPFLLALSSIYYLWSFWWWPFWLVWGDTSLWFWFAFLQWLLMSIFLCAFWPSIFFGERVI